MIKAIIFDCFGVLITDSLQALCDKLRETNPEAATEVSDVVRAMNRGIVDADKARQRMAELFGTDLSTFQTQVAAGEVKNQPLLDYILELKKNYKTAVLSNIPKDSLVRRFSEADLTKYFDVAVASGEIGHAKPEPEAYEITAERLGVRVEECVFIDDRLVFVEAAAQLGMKGIVYENFHPFKDELEAILAS